MTEDQFFNELESMMDLSPGSIKGDEVLSQIGQWDSLQILSFIVFVSDNFDLVINGEQVGRAVSVSDLAEFVRDRFHA